MGMLAPRSAGRWEDRVPCFTPAERQGGTSVAGERREQAFGLRPRSAAPADHPETGSECQMANQKILRSTAARRSIRRPLRPPRRPLTALYALVERWRCGFVGPLWRVELAWKPSRGRPSGAPVQVFSSPMTESVRIQIHPAVSDARAELLVAAALVELQLAEIRSQCAALLSAGSGPHLSPHATAGTDAASPSTSAADAP
jgi:hypothetical protein